MHRKFPYINQSLTACSLLAGFQILALWILSLFFPSLHYKPCQQTVGHPIIISHNLEYKIFQHKYKTFQIMAPAYFFDHISQNNNKQHPPPLLQFYFNNTYLSFFIMPGSLPDSAPLYRRTHTQQRHLLQKQFSC